MIGERIVFRIGLHRLLRAEADPEKKAAIRKALSNREFFEALSDESYAEYQFAASLPGSPLTDFLQWILDHSDEIIALIMKLLPLFI